MTAMRRTPLVAGLLAIASLVAACGGGSGGSDSSSGKDACPVDALAKATSPVEITFWHGMTASNETTLKALVQQYNESQKKVHVTAVYQGTYDDMSDKYITALRGGKLPNVIMLEETRIQPMIDSRSVVPVQDCVDAADYDLSDNLDAVLAEYTIDKTLWPMPFNVSGPVLYYDRNDFVKAGLDPDDPPNTFAELEAAAKAIKSSGAAKSGMALTLSPGNLEQFFNLAGKPIVDHDNGRSGRAERSLLSGTPGLDYLTFMRTMMQQGLAVNVGRNINEADNVLALGNGDAGMTIGTSAALGTIYAVKDAGQYKDVDPGVAPFPGEQAADGGINTSGAALWLVGKGTSDAQKAASWDFLKFLDQPAQQATWAMGTGYMPIRKGAVEDPKLKELWQRRPAYRVAFDQLARSKSGRGPVIGAYKEFRDAIVQAMEQVVIRGADPKQALADADKAATEAIRSYNERVGG